MLSSVLLLLLVSGAQAAYYGAVYSYSVGDLQPNGYPVTHGFRLSFSSCAEFDSVVCEGTCFGMPVYADDESRGEWCQTEYIVNLPVSFLSTLDSPFEYFTNWTENRNGIDSARIGLLIDLRNRSDINKPNSSPQTTILPLVRVPSNCQRNINLLLSDPNGDDIRCRYAAGAECYTCTPPSVLTLSPSCALSFSPTNSSAEGPYAVQLMVEDFPTRTIILTNGNYSQEVKTPNTSISKIPVQFVFKVDPAAPSCTEGEYLPRFLPPTPEAGAQINTTIGQTLEISISAEATQAVITELLFSGPHGVAKNSSGSGNFCLTWTPSESDGGLSYTLCFVVQANFSSSVYQSDLRCIILTTGNSPTAAPPLTTVAPLPTIFTFMSNITTQPPMTTTPPPATPPPATTTLTPTTTAPPTSSIPSSTLDPGPYYVLALTAKISTTLSLESDSGTIVTLIKNELARCGLPQNMIIKLLTNGTLIATIR